jgi:hypothetical protein
MDVSGQTLMPFDENSFRQFRGAQLREKSITVSDSRTRNGQTKYLGQTVARSGANVPYLPV